MTQPMPPNPNLPPEQLPDVTPLADAHQQALDDLQAEWQGLTDKQKQALVDAVYTAVAAGTVADLLTLPVDVAGTTAALTAAMVAIAAAAAHLLAGEAADQGVHVPAVHVPAAVFEPTAQVVAGTLGDELRITAARAALQYGPDATPTDVADAARASLDARSGASETKQLGGALHGAMNAGRIASLRRAPTGAVYAQEMNDRNTCGPCRAVNGRWLGNIPDDLPQILALYPDGAYGGYIDCLGGINCRGTITGVWRPDQVEAANRRRVLGFDPDQPRGPDGRWISLVEHLKDKIRHHLDTGEGDPFDGYNREQLRRVAKRRGHQLERGESRESISRKLLDGIGQQPTPTTEAAHSADPGKAYPWHLDLNGIEDLAAHVHSPAFATSPRHEITAGTEGRKEKVMMPDGTRIFTKTLDDSQFRTGKETADAEQLSSLVGRAIGAPVPRVYRSDATTIHTDWATGPSAWSVGKRDKDRYERASESRDGIRLGLLDLLVHNTDRHEANWLIDRQGNPTGIDHGHGWFAIEHFEREPKSYVLAPINFGGGKLARRHFANNRERLGDNPLTRHDITTLRQRLEKLRPDFQQLGRGRWLDDALTVVGLLAPHAKGAIDVL